MKYIVILSIFLTVISINEAHAEMSYSEFQDFCKETEDMNRDLMPIEQRQLAHFCDFLDSGLSEKYWNWIGSDLDWKNFVQNVANEHAQEMPLFVEKGFEDSLVVNTSISGRDSFPPPMFAYISFYYDEDNKTKRFGEKYFVKISGEFTKAKDHRLSPLKLFNIGYHLDEIQCKENLILLQKYDGSPACVTESTKQKLVERGWGTIVTQIDDKANTSKSMKLTNSDFVIYYNITGGDIVEVKNNMLERSIQIFLENTDQGMITITLQKSLIDSTFGQDFNSEFFVVVDKKEVEYEEIRTHTNSTLTINLQTGAKEIQIIGSGEM